MDKKKFIVLLTYFLILVTTMFSAGSCTKEGEYRCENTSTNRVGAMCKDGSRTDVVGSGACSGRGGVDYWICKR